MASLVSLSIDFYIKAECFIPNRLLEVLPSSENESLKCFQLLKDKGREPSELGFSHSSFDFYAL